MRDFKLREKLLNLKDKLDDNHVKRMIVMFDHRQKLYLEKFSKTLELLELRDKFEIKRHKERLEVIDKRMRK